MWWLATVTKLLKIETLFEINQLAKGSDLRVKSKKRKAAIEKYHSYCFVTKHDIDIQWVQCDQCNNWYHTMCEALTPLEEIQ